MIEKFVCDESVLRLRNRRYDRDVPGNIGVPEENIYDIDSISLLIGDNGAGKTHVLGSIFNGLDRLEPVARPFEWDPVFFDETESNFDHIGVVYFSHAPNHVRKKPNCRRCIDASPSPKRRYVPEWLLGKQDLLKEVTDIDPRFEAVLRINPRLLLRQCVGMMLNNLIPLPRFLRVMTRDFSELSHAYVQASKRGGQSERPGIRLPLPEYGRFPEFDRQLGQFLSEMFQVIVEPLPTELAVMFFFQLELLLRYRANTDEIVEFFERWWNGDLSNTPVMVQHGHGVEQAGELWEMLQGVHGPVEYKIEPREITATVVLESRVALDNIRNIPLAKNLRIGWMNVSSGLWALIIQYIELDKAVSKLSRMRDVTTVVVMIDEGDAFLHLEWQRKYIETMNRFLTRIKRNYKIQCLQLIIATHSPLLATDVPSAYVNRLEDRRMVGPKPSFAAPLQTILNSSFEAKTIGQYALQKIRETVSNVKSGNVTEIDRYLTSIVDDPIIARELGRLFEMQAESSK
jgi:hypothetical protein